ncbi:MAG: methylenetetrahydrofolate reductase [NAD(P)H] [Robiginitomaculum sp.]|nr:MAG: methylenetetrahydrofolate reductase [NAD(P)H] [Robiginitomaculum sp.]
MTQAIARGNSGNLRPIEVSFEFFPPKNQAMEDRLWQSVRKLAPLRPNFMSVTYGAGGSTRDRTRKTVVQMAQETGIEVAAHLTCVEASAKEIDDVVKTYKSAGINHIVALRGDPTSGIDGKYQPTADGYSYASDLVAALKKSPDTIVSVAAYPERHPESSNWQVEMDNLKRKVDAGADQAITQFGFEPGQMIDFLDRVRGAGINIPIVPGIMLQPNFDGLVRMSKMCGASIPKWMFNLFEGTKDDLVTRQLLTANIAAEYCTALQAAGFRRFHFYTLNNADFAYATCRVLGLKPHTGDAK